MRFLSLIILFFLYYLYPHSILASSSYGKWEYSITYFNDVEAPYLDVKVSFKNAAGKVTKFYLPETDHVNKTCSISNLSIGDDYTITPLPNNCAFEVHHKNNADINLRYIVKSFSNYDFVQIKTPFSALITNKYFYFVGTNVFLAVDMPNNNIVSNYKIIWNMPKKLSNITNVYGSGKVQKFITFQNDFLRNSYMGGDISNTKLGNKQYLVTTNFTKFDKDKFAKFWKQQLKVAKKMWHDDMNSNNYIINMSQFTEGVNDDDAWGIGSKESLGVFVYNIKNSLNDIEFSTLLTHEMLHRWIGGYIYIPEELWFIEGFTEFYARNLALSQSGNLEYYINWHNKSLRHYYTLQNNNNFKSRNTKKIVNFISPYIYGYLFASDINYQINKHSKGQYNLLNVVRNLYDEAKLSNSSLTIQNFIQAGEKYWDKFGNYFKEKMQNKQGELSGNDGELGKCVKLVYKEYYEANYGLDHIAAMNSMVIDGVKIGSKLYNIGLRNGQKVLQFKILDEMAQDLPIQLTVLTSVGEKIVTIRRYGKLLKVPQYELIHQIYDKNPIKCLKYFAI